MIELDQIIDGLVQRTLEGKLVWKQSVPKGRFVTAVNRIAVGIDTTDDGNCRLGIYNESGDLVMSLSRRNTDDKAQLQKLECLYEFARRSALDVGATLEKLAKDLEARA